MTTPTRDETVVKVPDVEPTPEPSTTPTPPPRSPAAIGWALTLVAVGVLWLLDVLGVALPWELVLPLSVMIVGIVLVGLSFTGSHSGLITLAIVLTVLATVVAVFDSPLSLSAGERLYRPATVAELEPDYSLGMGTMTVDLRGLALDEAMTTVTASVTMGELVIHPPDDIRVVVSADVGAGEIIVFDRTESGLGPGFETTEGPSSGPTLVIDASVAMGTIEVTP